MLRCPGLPAYFAIAFTFAALFFLIHASVIFLRSCEASNLILLPTQNLNLHLKLTAMKRLVLLMAFLLPVLVVLAQSHNLTGKVTDESGIPVAGATVTVKGTSNSVVADANGIYSITVGNNAKTLIISHVGKSNQEISIGNKTVLDASLKQEESTMQEVVVVGYGTQRRRDVTGNVSKISGDAVRNSPVQSFDQALSGRAAGVSVTLSKRNFP